VKPFVAGFPRLDRSKKETLRDPTARKALELLRKIKSVTFATVNHGEPAARIFHEPRLWRGCDRFRILAFGFMNAD
jgi:hypothetical protein